MNNVIVTLGDYYENELGETVRIIGTVNEGTIEWSDGLRYFDSAGRLYFEDGRFTSMVSPNDLIGPKSIAEEDTRYLSRKRFVKEELENHQRFIPNDDPEFKIERTGLYVNRMGFLVTYDYYTGVVEYGDFGDRYRGLISMMDFTHQLRAGL